MQLVKYKILNANSDSCPVQASVTLFILVVKSKTNLFFFCDKSK